MSERPSRSLAELSPRYSGYEARDENGERIGTVEEIFVDESGRPEYIGVDAGSAAGGRALVPVEKVTRWQEDRGVMEISQTTEKVLGGPALEGPTMSRDYEERLRRYYGLYGGSSYRSSRQPRSTDEESGGATIAVPGAGGRPVSTGSESLQSWIKDPTVMILGGAALFLVGRWFGRRRG